MASELAIDAAAKALVGALGKRDAEQIERTWSLMDEAARESFRVPAMEIVEAYQQAKGRQG